MKRLLNSRITWILVPAGILALIWWALETASSPISEPAMKRVVTRLSANAQADPAIPWKHLAKIESFLGSTDEYLLIQKLPPDMRGLFMLGSPSKFSELAAFAQTEAEAYDELLQGIKKQLETYKRGDPDVLFVPDRSFQSIQFIVAAGAVGSARSGNIEQALDRLDFALELCQRDFLHYMGSSPWQLRWQFEAIKKVAETTTAPEVLTYTAKLTDDYKLLLKPARTSLNPWLATLINNPDKNLPPESLDSLVWRVIYDVAARDNELPQEYLQKLLLHLPDQGHGAIPWTTPLLAKEIMLKRAAETEHIWRNEIPGIYLQGLQGRDKLVAVSLLMLPQTMKDFYYVTRRSAATELLLTKAKILTSVYFSKNGKLPESLSELEPLGLELPADTKWSDVQEALEDHAAITDDGLPFGPVEIELITLSDQALNEWLALPQFMNLTSSSFDRIPKAADHNTSPGETALVSVELTAGEGPYLTTWPNLVAELREFAFRQDLELTSVTVTGSKGTVSLSKSELLDLRTTTPEGVGLSLSEEMAMQSENNFPVVTPDPGERTGLSPGQYRIAIDLIAPTKLVKLHLKSNLLPKIKSYSFYTPQPAYWAPPRSLPTGNTGS